MKSKSLILTPQEVSELLQKQDINNHELLEVLVTSLLTSSKHFTDLKNEVETLKEQLTQQEAFFTEIQKYFPISETIYLNDNID